MFEPPINEPLNIPLPSVICTDELTTPSGNNDITCKDEETTFVLSKVLSTEPLITPVPSKVLSTEPLITPVPSKFLKTEPLTTLQFHLNFLIHFHLLPQFHLNF